MSARRVYLDWNATAPPWPEVVEVMRQTALEAWANPSSVHAEGRKARAIIETLREAIAQLVEADPRDVILTSGGSEANALALNGARALVASRLDHPSVTRAAEALGDRGVAVAWLPVAPSGRLAPDSVRSALAELGQVAGDVDLWQALERDLFDGVGALVEHAGDPHLQRGARRPRQQPEHVPHFFQALFPHRFPRGGGGHFHRGAVRDPAGFRFQVRADLPLAFVHAAPGGVVRLRPHR